MIDNDIIFNKVEQVLKNSGPMMSSDIKNILKLKRSVQLNSLLLIDSRNNPKSPFIKISPGKWWTKQNWEKSLLENPEMSIPAKNK